MRPCLNLRILAILVTFGTTVAALGRMWLAPSPIERPAVPVALPGASPLPSWEAVTAEPADPTMPNTRRYRRSQSEPAMDLEIQFIPNLPEHYVRNPRLALRFLPHGHLPLDATMQHYVNSRAMVISNLDSNVPNWESVESRAASPRTAHGIWSAGERLHLSTILTPDGATAMATRRVARSMYLDHLTASRLGGWLLGRTTIPDRRCVLVHFSMAATAPATEAGRHQLEVAWADWQRVFQPVFPE